MQNTLNILTNPISNIPKLKNSHVLGWSLIWANQLNATLNNSCSSDIADANTVYIEHGVNFGGTLNLFGGASEEIYDRINRVAIHPNVISLDFDMPDWGAQLKSRINAQTTFSGITEEWCDVISERLSTIPSLKQQDLKNMKGITVGDSHSSAYASLTDMIFYQNGKTLFSTLKRGLNTEFRGIKPFGKVTFCYGSIDIRHHILRHADFNLDEMLDDYVSQALAIGKEHNCEIEFSAPVPVEYEGRRLPKTGYFKGTPFFGSRQERLDVTMKFINGLKKRGVTVIMPPEEWYKMDPEKYAKDHMENGSSVHIAPAFRRRMNWGEICSQ